MADIELTSVVKRYPDGSTAVQELSLAIADGEFMVLVGPSGCGKTTTLRMIAGLEDITQGSLRIGPRLVNGVPPGRRGIAMVFQNYALYPHMTVAKNMGFALKRAGIDKREIQRRVSEAAQILGITEHLHRRPANLSGGQRQRVAMGRALVREPEAFLLDEPLSNLDASLRGQMRAEISRIQRRLQATTVYVTHDQVEAMTLADRMAVMRDGVLQQVGTPSDIFERPANTFVAGFVGSPSMNFLAGRVEASRLFLGSTSVPIEGALAHRLAQHEGRGNILVGVRPENLSASPPADDGCIPLDGVVDLLEPTGSDVFAHLRLQASSDGIAELVARLEPDHALREGDKGRLWVAPESLHLFDATSGDRLNA